MDFRKMYDSDYIASWDLEEDTTLTIAKVVAGEVEGGKGEKQKRPLMFFENAKKAMVINKTNGRIVAGMYGNDTEGWVGKKVTLYATTCEAFGETVECLRIRVGVPK